MDGDSPMSHSTNENTNRMSIRNRWQIFRQLDRGRIERQSDLVTIRRQVVGDWILDDFQQFL